MSKLSIKVTIVIIIIVGAIIFISSRSNAPTIESTKQTAKAITPVTEQKKVSLLHEPLVNALTRVTKKPFGIYITPKTSPVQPEKFMGFHTGVDFETTSAEQKTDVTIYAVCDGVLKIKKIATGYGGVAVESCKLDNKDVTIIYGHLRLASVTTKVGATLKAGAKLGVLGTGFSSETSGERKHLHLGIHLGTSINILGYVQIKSALSQWLDATKYLD